jgi:hypothetical protein
MYDFEEQILVLFYYVFCSHLHYQKEMDGNSKLDEAQRTLHEISLKYSWRKELTSAQFSFGYWWSDVLRMRCVRDVSKL